MGLGELDLLPGQKGLEVFFGRLLAWKPMVAKKAVPRARRAFAAFRSSSALASHCRTRSRLTSSGGLIDHLPIFVGRIGDAPYDSFAFFEAFGGHDDDVKGVV